MILQFDVCPTNGCKTWHHLKVNINPISMAVTLDDVEIVRNYRFRWMHRFYRWVDRLFRRYGFYSMTMYDDTKIGTNTRKQS